MPTIVKCDTTWIYKNGRQEWWVQFCIDFAGFWHFSFDIYVLKKFMVSADYVVLCFSLLFVFKMIQKRFRFHFLTNALVTGSMI